VLVAGSTAGGVALFLAQARPGRLVASLASLPPTSVLTAVGATMAGVMLGAVRWRSLLAAGGVPAPAPRLFAALTIGSAVNNLVPARGGDAVRVESAHQLTGAPRLAVAGTMLSERILDGFVLALLIVSGALLDGVQGAFLWVGAAVAAAIALAALVLGRFGRHALHGRLAGLEAGLAVFRVPRVVGPALAATAGIWFADVVMYAALARGPNESRSRRFIARRCRQIALAIPGAAAGSAASGSYACGAHGIGVGGASWPRSCSLSRRHRPAADRDRRAARALRFRERSSSARRTRSQRSLTGWRREPEARTFVHCTGRGVHHSSPLDAGSAKCSGAELRHSRRRAPALRSRSGGSTATWRSAG
jgi:hypothetical protein